MFGVQFLHYRLVDATYFWDLDFIGHTFVVSLEECFGVLVVSKE